jgi:hypothetical protein
MHRNLHMGANAYEEELEHMHGSLRICTGASAYIYTIHPAHADKSEGGCGPPQKNQNQTLWWTQRQLTVLFFLLTTQLLCSSRFGWMKQTKYVHNNNDCVC